MEKFERLGMSKELVNVLKDFGFKEPSEIQEKAIPLALAGKDIIGSSATGSGKTLVFASPMIENLIPNSHVQGLILTPTRELAEQVMTTIKRFFDKKKRNILAIYGGVNIQEQIRKLYNTDIVVGTPGRILDHLNRRTLNLRSVKFLVLDEADRMFDMGFHRDVEKILSQCPTDRQTMMFSATISDDLDYLAKKYTRNPIKISVNSYVDASQLKQIYYDVSDEEKFSLLIHLLREDKNALSMVFCRTRKNVDFLAKNMETLGINSKAIHGGLPQNRRIKILEEFHQKKINVLICTDVAGRGLDIKGVSHVYNYDIPPTSEDYIHRVGRTARAGKDGKAVSLLSNKDYENFRNIFKDESLKITAEDVPNIQFIPTKKSYSPRRSNFRGRPRDNRYNQNRKRRFR
ncbi:MAG: DEAD/DEAH box helicase [Nanoarchaeota archaeon]|nr:DEAD/DEAH box helicase [Nanoarchaeota archaeon]